MTRDLSFLCETAEFPGRGFMNVDVRHYGPNFKLPYQTTYEDINLAFLCRTEGLEREFFDSWMETINPTQTFDFEYKNNYSCNIDIFHFSDVEGDGAMYHFRLIDAYPILVSPQPVTWADADFLRLGVSFTYTKWIRPELDNSPYKSALLFDKQVTTIDSSTFSVSTNNQNR
jgi:hypothetical protein